MLKDYYDKALSKKALAAINDELSYIPYYHRFDTYSAARKSKVSSDERVLLYRGIYYVAADYIISGIKNKIAFYRKVDEWER